MKSLIALCVLFTICLTSSDALVCYSCTYFQGHPASDAQCQTSPSSASAGTCLLNSALPSASLSVRKGIFNRNETSEVLSTNGTESRQTYMTLCSTFTGTLDGRAIVARSCFPAYREFIGVCSRDVYLEVEGRNASNVLGCFCGSDRCNSATNINFTYFSFIVIAMIHVMYKFL